MIARKRNMQLLRHALEGEADLEGQIGHGEVPELVLQDDRHLARISAASREEMRTPGNWVLKVMKK